MEVIRKELETGKIMFVPVPEGANEFKLFNFSRSGLYLKQTDSKELNGFDYKLPQGNWQLLGISDQLTEDDLSLIGLNLEAFKSLKESFGIVDVNKYNNKPVKIVTGNLGIDDAEWQQEQSKVRKHIVLFEAKK